MSYQQDALRTEPDNDSYDAARERADDHTIVRLEHARDGFATETGEFADVLKKYKFYGKPLDKPNLIEELGDLMWYIAIACDALGTTIEEVQAINIAKLKSRYAEKFTEHAAINRDLDAERAILEQDNPKERGT